MSVMVLARMPGGLPPAHGAYGESEIEMVKHHRWSVQRVVINPGTDTEREFHVEMDPEQIIAAAPGFWAFSPEFTTARIYLASGLPYSDGRRTGDTTWEWTND